MCTLIDNIYVFFPKDSFSVFFFCSCEAKDFFTTHYKAIMNVHTDLDICT